MYGFEQLIISTEVFKPNFIVLLGDYNAQSKAWWDFDTSISEGIQYDALTSSAS